MLARRKSRSSAQRGGLSLIRILDDGYGMSRDDALLSLERHATSKLHTKADLGNITTLGFRGEALPSIASVSRFRLTTREADALTGTEINVDGGRLGDIHDSGEAPGTQIEVRSLFYNLPARRKFLRAESTEFSHIEQQVRVHAIAYPHIAFTLRHGDRLVFQLPATSDLRERIAGIAGNEIAQRLIHIPEQERSGVKVHGYMAHRESVAPTASTSSASLTSARSRARRSISPCAMPITGRSAAGSHRSVSSSSSSTRDQSTSTSTPQNGRCASITPGRPNRF